MLVAELFLFGQIQTAHSQEERFIFQTAKSVFFQNINQLLSPFSVA